jgi:predicted TIM-barrel enzyme
VILGSGISEDNIVDFYHEADGFIIGSSFKVDGLWSNTVDPARVGRFITILNKLRSEQTT